MSRALRRRVAALLEQLGLKHRLKPPLIDLLDLLKVPHGLMRDPTVFEDLKRLARDSTPSEASPRVLVSSFRGAWLLHGTIEALLAEGLRRRGARPTVFVCSGGLPETLVNHAPACGIANVHDTRIFSCANCFRCGSTLAGSLGLPVVALQDLLAPGRAQTLQSPLDRMSAQELRTLNQAGMPLGSWALTMSRWFLCVSDLDTVPEGPEVLRSFCKTAVLLAEAAPVLFDRVKPDVVLLLNGLFLAERILAAEARRRGIRSVTYEHGQMPDTYCFSESVANYYDLGALWDEVRDSPLTPEEDGRLEAYLAERRRGVPGINDWPMVVEAEQDIRKRLSLDRGRPAALLFTNVTWDSAAQDRDRGFSSMFAWIVESVRLAEARPEMDLVIRIHPGEVGLKGWQTRDPVEPRLRAAYPQLPSNVRIVPPESDLSSYALIRLARCGLVYTSTVGLEMAMEGYPVVVAGDVHYAGKGFTSDPSDPADYRLRVAEALKAPLSPDIRARARRYGHALFFRFFHPFPLVSERYPDLVPLVNANDPSVLEPGADPTLDLVCRGILAGEPFHISSGKPPRRIASVLE